MRRKILFIVASLTVLIMLAGCGDYSEIEQRLREIEIENQLPDVPDMDYTTLEEAEDAVYDQQIGACLMLADTYNQTYYENFTEDAPGSIKRIMEICNAKRQSINEDIEELYKNNVYRILEDVRDCPNIDAHVTKTYNNVLTFYDEYNNYLNAERPEEALTEILTYYYDRTNILAKSFLVRNKQEVFDSAVEMIEEYAKAEDDYRFYINKNNIIIKAINEIFGGVSSEYADRIEKSSDILARNLINSMDSLTDRERGQLMDELGLSTPTPSPKPTATPKPTDDPDATPTPSPRPTVTPSPAPKATADPKPTTTPKPKATGAPAEDNEEKKTEEPSKPTYTLE